MQTIVKSVDELTEIVRIAKRDVERAKCLYYNHEATYDDMAEAARRLSAATYDYGRAKFPGRRIPRIPYQAILR